MSDILLPRKKPSAFPILAVAVPAAVLAASLGLGLLSMPPHVRDRVAVLESQAGTIRVASTTGGDMKTFPDGSVCAGDFGDAGRQKLKTSLADSGLKVAAFDLTDIGAAGRTGLEAYRFAIKGDGSYAQAMSALAVMDAVQPRLFVDSLALRNHLDSVELEIEGRLFCR